ncbi:MAG: type I methionyl aminopeptidase [Caldiserica bacterium]|jgi:methionyl aminopeptidase|nr:type I methionyl aminopeptidase [Caldisericota bacterium]MDH7563143.1 type I methionyl aminopeptidase [Caldisericota bacterium]
MVKIKSKGEIDKIQKAGSILSRVLKLLKEAVKPGIKTLELDSLAERAILTAGGLPAFKGYRGFPASLCVSVNDEVVHGIPGNRVLKEGDIVSLDLGVVVDGYYADAAITVPVGRVSPLAQKLLFVCREALMAGIRNAFPRKHLNDISSAIQNEAERHGFSVVRDFVGHGIGRALHEEPQVPNFSIPENGLILEEGMTLAIEPMVNTGTYQVKVRPDGWTVITQDGGLSAHFEHTVAITSSGPKILTEFK